MPVKRVIDYAIKPRVNASRTAVVTASVKHSMNPFDELSIEAAVRLRESSSSPSSNTPYSVADILALSIGPAKCSDVLRTAMAMGADRSIHVAVEDQGKDAGGGGEGELEPLGVAKVLQEVVKREGCNLVILGKQSIDGDNGQTGQMLAGLLGWGQATQASKIDIVPGEGGGNEDAAAKVEVKCEVDGGVETLRSRIPMVITTDLRLNEPRYASLPNIMKAKKKTLEKKTLADYGLEESAGARRLRTLKVEEPPPRQGGGKVADVDGMISKLKELGAI